MCALKSKGQGLNTISRWLDENVRSLVRDMRWSFLPPLMVYMAAGVQGLTGIVGTFFVKEHLGLSAEFLAALAFWAGLPWALKMPIGHLVDIFWRHKSGFILLGASLIAASLLIMAGLVGQRDAMASVWSVNHWFVLAALLSPIGYVLQDATADAMTVEAVPKYKTDGSPVDPATLKLMHTTMQTLGRVAIVGGTIVVALINLAMFADVQTLTAAQKTDTYRNLYLMALIIPLLSVAGLVVARLQRTAQVRQHMARGLDRHQALALLRPDDVETAPNAVLLVGSLFFVALTIGLGLSGWRYSQELIFVSSMAIIGTLMARLMRELEPSARQTLLGTALVIFMFRAVPGTGAGMNWWMIDELGFDQPFFSVLSLIGSTLALAGMFVFRRFMSTRSIFYVVGALTVLGSFPGFPTLARRVSVHDWTSVPAGGVVVARLIALVDTALESPLGQISMIPMLVWIANSAPPHLKATYFAVMASFTNLALSAAQLGTKYLNQIFTLTRQVKDASGAITVPANYADLSGLLLTALLIGLLMPLAAIAFARWRGWGSA